MNWYEPFCCDSWRNAPDLQTCVAWSCENFWGFKIMKSKGSAWDVVFSDLSLNTALSALTHGSPRKRALGIREWCRGKRVSRESILHFPGINRLGNRKIRCIYSMPIATLNFFIWFHFRQLGPSVNQAACSKEEGWSWLFCETNYAGPTDNRSRESQSQMRF